VRADGDTARSRPAPGRGEPAREPQGTPNAGPGTAGTPGSSGRSPSSCSPPDDPEAAIEKLAAPATRIVSLTITEGGYNLDPVTGEFSSSSPQVAAGQAPRAAPRTVFGLVTEALARRRERGIPAFIVLSCDNIQGNGHASARSRPSPACAAAGSPSGSDETGQPHEINDARAPQLRAAARRQHSHPAAFVEDNRAIFGDLADDTRFTRVYTTILASLQERGVRATLADLDHYAAA